MATDELRDGHYRPAALWGMYNRVRRPKPLCRAARRVRRAGVAACDTAGDTFHAAPADASLRPLIRATAAAAALHGSPLGGNHSVPLCAAGTCSAAGEFGWMIA